MSRRFRVAAVLASLTAVAAAAGLVAPAAARADDTCTIRWNGGGGSWSDPSRWTPVRVPTPGDDVCVEHATGASPVSVRVSANVDNSSLTLTGATLAVAPTARFFGNQILATRSTFAGGGIVQGSTGIVELHDSKLAGVQLQYPARLIVGGALTFSGGAGIVSSSGVDLLPGTRIVDADGNTGNRMQLSQFPLYLQGSVFVGVRLALDGVLLLTQGDTVLAHLDNLDADGNLTSPSTRNLVQLGASGDGSSLTLQRSITSIGRRVSVFAGDLRTADGGDALSGLRSVAGTLSISRTLLSSGVPLAVSGSVFASSTTLIVPVVLVRPGARFVGDRVVAGALSCAGSCAIAGAHLFRLSVLAGATVEAVLTEPVVVDGAAQLGGRLDLSVPGNAQPGDVYVLVTAGGGVTGRFGQVTTTRPTRTVTPRYQSSYVTGIVGAAA